MKKTTNILKFIALILISASSLYSSQNALKKAPYFFDLGSDTSTLSEFAVKITADSIYKDGKSYGLLGNNYQPFVEDELRREIVRDELTYDGLRASECGFRINLPEGEWFFTFWVETGRETKSTIKLDIDGKEQNIVWHELREDEEGSKAKLDIYRVVHTKITVGNNGVEFKLTRESEPVELLGFSFSPLPEVKTELHKQFSRIIKEAGLYRSKVELDDLALALKNSLRVYPEDPFYFYWAQQAGMLAKAKQILDTQGWEWARQITGQSIFDRMHQVLFLLDAQIENFDTTAYPLLERSMWYRGKLCYDLYSERGGDYQNMTAKKDLKKLYSRYSEDNALAMLNGEKVDVRDYCDNLQAVDGAPLWSTLQHEAICRLQSEISWWVNEKQAPNGELGGKIGDDVEILRWWSTFLLLGDHNTIKGWTKLAEAVWSDPKVYRGFSKEIRDVEHSSEFISDSTPELILIDYPGVEKTLDYTAEYFRDLWSFKNDNGHRFFKSAWYSSTEVDERPPRDRDVGYNTRAIKPLRYLAWFTRKPEYVDLLKEWADGWLYLAMRTDKNKPEGIIPASVRCSDEKVNGDEPTWYEANMLWNYFNWAHDSGSMILDQLLFTYTITNDKKYLEPIELSLNLVATYEKEFGNYDNLEKGSEAWAAYHLADEPGFWEVVQNWRMITQNNKYDRLILEYGVAYTKFSLTGNKDYLTNALNFLLENIRYNSALRTNLVLHTDRVYVRGNEILKAMITGNGSSGVSPYYQVTWENADNDLTILVDQSDKDSLSIDLFSYVEDSQNVILRPWILTEGSYNLSLLGDDYLYTDKLTITKTGQKISISVPSKKLVTLKLTRVEE